MIRTMPRRPLAALVGAALTVCSARAPVEAQPAAAPAVLSTPAAQASAQAPCAAVLVNIAPLYASGADKTNFYALLLRSTDVQQRTVSGVLSLHTASARYDVSFSGAVAAGLTFDGRCTRDRRTVPRRRGDRPWATDADQRQHVRAVHGPEPLSVRPLPAPAERSRGRGGRRAPHLRARSRCRTGAAVRPRRGRDHRSGPLSEVSRQYGVGGAQSRGLSPGRRRRNAPRCGDRGVVEQRPRRRLRAAIGAGIDVSKRRKARAPSAPSSRCASN